MQLVVEKLCQSRSVLLCSSNLREAPVLPLEELGAHGELVLLLALRLPRPLRRQVVLHAALPILIVL